ncbi:sigma-70 family RNA polymerase sigma factor [Streptomyces sp. NPDC127074]|uniref:sigma-70 family RNA polymerase sigma factor n=1 Tax=Streptomyces sp. NPDC127074 TaxID=3347130 RepID=UPI0036640FB2
MTVVRQRPLVHVPDDELAAALRRGEPAAEELAELYTRHRSAVRAYAAACCRDAHTADDITSEAFARTIDATRRGGGPNGAWRSYLLTAARRIAIDWSARDRRIQPSEEIEDQVDQTLTGEALALSREEDELVVRSFQLLPERWQQVLWYTVVKEESAATVGARLGLSESGVGSLALRAREGLREAYLSVHATRGSGGDECGRYSALLAAAVRRKGKRPGRPLQRHLEGCAPCRQAMVDLTDLNSRLRTVLPGAILLGGAGYLAAQAGTTKTALAGATVSSTSLAAQLHLPAAASVTLAAGCCFALLPFGSPSPKDAAPPRASASPVAPASPGSPVPSPAEPGSPVRDGRLPEGGSTALRSMSTGRCLEAVPAARGGGVRMAGCDGGAEQSWVRLQFRGRTVLLRNVSSDLCLRDSGPRAVSGELRACDSGDGRQVWRFEYRVEARSLVFAGSGGGVFRI